MSQIRRVDQIWIDISKKKYILYDISNVLSLNMWQVEYTDEFEVWWNKLNEAVQINIDASVQLLEKMGIYLPFPHSSKINESKHSHMRELRVQSKGKPIRILYAFDPKRHAILLIGGGKTGDNDWYEKYIPIADKLYDEHLQEITPEE